MILELVAIYYIEVGKIKKVYFIQSKELEVP